MIARWRTTIVAPVVLAGALPIGVAAASTSKVIGYGAQLKGSQVWYAHGKAVTPRMLSARVAPAAGQSAKVQWSVVCQKPNKLDPAIPVETNERSGQTSVRARATVNLTLPYARPPVCVATVYATLARRGRLTLEVLEN